jgi:hypothetical protein
MTQKHYLVEFNIVRQISYAQMVVLAESEAEAKRMVSTEVARQYNDKYSSGYYADISDTMAVEPDDVAEHNLNTILDEEEF